VAALRATVDELVAWDQANTKLLQAIAEESPRVYERIRANVLEVRDKLLQDQPDEYNQEIAEMPPVPDFLDRRS
jgi:hypothetical protein